MFARVLFIAAVILPTCVFAGLSPDELSKDVVVPVTEPAATTRFTLFNDGPDKVTILKTTTSCDCTSVAVDKEDVAPGEKISLTAKIDTSSKAGNSDIHISIWTDPIKGPMMLTIHLKIPEVVAVTAPIVRWGIRENPKAKIVTVSLLKGLDGSVIKVSPSNSSLIVASASPNENGTFNVSLRPPGTQVGFIGGTTLMITAIVNADGKRVIKTQRIVVTVLVSAADATQPAK